jgi:hypothetical protein
MLRSGAPRLSGARAAAWSASASDGEETPKRLGAKK